MTITITATGFELSADSSNYIGIWTDHNPEANYVRLHHNIYRWFNNYDRIKITNLKIQK